MVSKELMATLGVGVALLGFLWKLHLDMTSVRERLAGLEATVALIVQGLEITIGAN